MIHSFKYIFFLFINNMSFAIYQLKMMFHQYDQSNLKFTSTTHARLLTTRHSGLLKLELQKYVP